MKGTGRTVEALKGLRAKRPQRRYEDDPESEVMNTPETQRGSDLRFTKPPEDPFD